MERIIAFILVLATLVEATPWIGMIDEVWNPMSGSATRPVKPVQIYQSGDTFELHCEGEQAGMIEWNYPSKGQAEDYYGTVDITQSQVPDSDMELSILKITGASYMDTGNYECFCAGMADLEHSITHAGGRMIGRRNVYVFVRDAEHMFIGEPQEHREGIMAVTKSTATIPCKVTDPEVQVSLVKGEGHGKVIPIDNERTYYDDREGFRLESVSVRNSGAYTCRATKGDQIEERRFVLYTLRSMPLIMEPVITLRGSHVMTIGSQASFKCQVAVGRDQLTTIKWFRKADGHVTQIDSETPRVDIEPETVEDMCSGGRVRCSFQQRFRHEVDSHYEKVTSRLRIAGVQEADSGDYYCEAWSSFVTEKSPMLSVIVQSLEVVPYGESSGGLVVDTASWSLD